jgi:hypothetical protein
MRFEILVLRRSDHQTSSSLIDAHLFNLLLPYLVSHPGRRALGLVYLHPLAREYMHLLCAPLPESDVCVAPFGGLKGFLAR